MDIHTQTDAANHITLLYIHTHTHTYTQGTYMSVHVLSACHVPAQDLHVDSTEIMSCFHDKVVIIIVSSIIIPLSPFLLPSLPPTTICLQQMVVGSLNHTECTITGQVDISQITQEWVY